MFQLQLSVPGTGMGHPVRCTHSQMSLEQSPAVCAQRQRQCGTQRAQWHGLVTIQ